MMMMMKDELDWLFTIVTNIKSLRLQVKAWPAVHVTNVTEILNKTLSYRKDRAAGCVSVLARSGRLELGDNILQTL